MGAEATLATGFAIGIHLSFIIWVTVTGLIAMWLTKISFGEIFYLSQRAEGERPARAEAT